VATPSSNPERDRHLAAKPRYGWRDAESVGDAVDSILGSREFVRMKRFQRVAGALKAVLPPAAAGRVRPALYKNGVLTLEVFDTPLLAELRQYHHHRLLDELVARGTGVSKLIWRIARSR
jgi:hypothetical protein